MRFRFMGKRKLLKILREKSNKSNISLKDVSYTTEDRFEGWRQETILLIEESEKETHYRVRHSNIKGTGTTLFYEEIQKVGPSYFKIRQKNLLQESEGQK